MDNENKDDPQFGKLLQLWSQLADPSSELFPRGGKPIDEDVPPEVMETIVANCKKWFGTPASEEERKAKRDKLVLARKRCEAHIELLDKLISLMENELGHQQ